MPDYNRADAEYSLQRMTLELLSCFYRVGYWEPAKWVAKLREAKTDDRLLLFKCDTGAGHFSKSGR